MIKAAIDIGSNSVQFLVLDTISKIELEREQFVTSLGRGIDTNSEFDNDSMNDTLNALKFCVEKCKKYKVEASDILMTATEASRLAKNSDAFYQKVFLDTGLKVKIISAEDEAFYSSLGALSELKNSSEDIYVTFDIGGASTELTKFNLKEKSIIKTISLPVGSVRLTNWYLKKEKDKFEEVLNGYNFSAFKDNQIIAIAGTCTSIANIILKNKVFDDKTINSAMLRLSDVIELKASLVGLTDVEILKKYPFLGKRSKVLKAGVNIFIRVLEILKVSELRVSTKGLVNGLILKDL